MFAYNYQPPSDDETEVAKAASTKLLKFPAENAPISLHLISADGTEQIELPVGVASILKDLLQTVAEGHGITLIPRHAELTTMQAADVLNVSRPYLIKLLESGEIAYRTVGRHRRVRMEDVMNYKEAIDLRREAVLDELVAEAQELGMGYDKH